MSRDAFLPNPFPPFDPREQGRNQAVSYQSDWDKLSRGKTLGKRVQLLNDGTSFLNTNLNILEVKGDDSAAMNLQITIAPPKVIPVGAAGEVTLAVARDLVANQNGSGSVDNQSTSLMGARNFQWLPLIARIEWGVGGVAVDRVEVDISNGLCINITASFVRISCTVDPFIELVQHGVPGDFSSAIYEISAFIGPGHTKPRNAQRTIHMPVLTTAAPPDAASTSPIVPIPKFAVSALVGAVESSNVSYPDIGWILQLVFALNQGGGVAFALNPDLNGANPPFKVASFTVADNAQFMEIPVPNNAKYFCVINNSSFNVESFVTFTLGI